MTHGIFCVTREVPCVHKCTTQILSDSTWAVIMSVCSFPLHLNFPDNPHHPGYCKSTCSSVISRAWSNKSGDLAMAQTQIVMSSKAFHSYGSIKFVKHLWFAISETFPETLRLSLWAIPWAQGREEGKENGRVYFKHRNILHLRCLYPLPLSPSTASFMKTSLLKEHWIRFARLKHEDQ